MTSRRTFINAAFAAAFLGRALPAAAIRLPRPLAERHRVIVSTDIGGTDPDDLQSMVHLLVCADSLDLEGLISSPYGEGRVRHILDIIDLYAQDYPALRRHSPAYPSADALREITRQGATEVAGYTGVSQASEGSDWIAECARRDDDRPLHVLVWGGIEDLAQALHDAPDILPRLRVHFVGGPNKKWSVDAYHYIATHHPTLWIIESNATYRGWFEGGDQSGDLGNASFVATHVAGKGALGTYFASLLDGVMKMGDSPTVAWLLGGNPADPSSPGWGGRFVRAWRRPYVLARGVTDAGDVIEQFGVLELALDTGALPVDRPEAWMVIENQELRGYFGRTGEVRFRFSPKDAKTYDYAIRGNVVALDGKQGRITAVRPPPSRALHPDPDLPNWWTDDPSPDLAEGSYIGVRTVSRWRAAFLGDFAARMRRCVPGASG